MDNSLARPRSFSRLQTDLDAHFSRNRVNDYDHIECLILYWKDADSDGYKEESLKIQSFFQSKLNYKATLYAIPSENSFWELDKEINRFMEPVRQKHCLAIIHYGGHGDPDMERDENRSRPLRSVWAARSASNSPKLSWSDLQPKLGNSQGHVLLILDCCFAAQAARGVERIIPPNVELVCACAMSVKTAPPSEYSFTTKWLSEADFRLTSDGYILISDMHDTMSSRDKGALQTPQHWGLQGRQSTIRLDPLPQLDLCIQPPREFKDELWIRIMTRHPLDEALLDDILDWLKTYAPRQISSVKVKEAASMARGLQKFVLEPQIASRSVATLGNMPQGSQREIRSSWEKFKLSMASTVRDLTVGLTTDWSSEGVADGMIVSDFLNNLEQNVQALQRVVQQGVLSIPQLDEINSLTDAANDANLDSLEVTDILRTRLLACFPDTIHNSLEKPPDQIQHSKKHDSPSMTIEEQDHCEFGRILVEYKPYESMDETSIEVCRRKVNRLAIVLQNAEPKRYHTPKCVGWSHEKRASRFALMFQLPNDDWQSPISLRQILDMHNDNSSPRGETSKSKIDKPSLAERFNILRKIGRAVARWHSAGWLHQGIASFNIIFLRDSAGAIRYDEPFLCGFEFSRMYNEFSRDKHLYRTDVDVYKHPDRQGERPEVRHTQDHDYYSFGLLMVEVALWDSISMLFQGTIKKKGAIEVRNRAIKEVRGLLRHSVGEAFEQATLLCLQAEFHSTGYEAMSTMQSTVKIFEDHILNALDADPTLGIKTI